MIDDSFRQTILSDLRGGGILGDLNETLTDILMAQTSPAGVIAFVKTLLLGLFLSLDDAEVRDGRADEKILAYADYIMEMIDEARADVRARDH